MPVSTVPKNPKKEMISIMIKIIEWSEAEVNYSVNRFRTYSPSASHRDFFAVSWVLVFRTFRSVGNCFSHSRSERDFVAKNETS